MKQQRRRKDDRAHHQLRRREESDRACMPQHECLPLMRRFMSAWVGTTRKQTELSG
jgi:hypothetical protein